MYTFIIIIANAWVQRKKQRFAKRAQNTLTSHLLMPQGVLEIKSNPVQKDEKKGSIQGSHNNNNNNN